MAAWYERRGGSVVARNWRVRSGEIDLVVLDGGVLVVCEVKTRSGPRFGSPLEAVGPDKQRRLRHLALRFVDGNPRWRDRPLRFDVAAVTPEGIEVVTAAF